MLSTLPVSLSACASLRRATRAVCHLYDLVLAPTGLKSTQFIILQAIADAGEIAHCDLARTLAASEETLSRRLASARVSGWVRMKVGERSRRIYCLTECGQKTLEAAQPFWERAEDRMKREAGEADWLDLSAFSERVTRAAIRAEHAPTRNDRPCSVVRNQSFNGAPQYATAMRGAPDNGSRHPETASAPARAAEPTSP
ncbi:MAG TPA: MarR family winged helix-turn-helix transcriptional regulator [Acidobacteriaceae bacterium]